MFAGCQSTLTKDWRMQFLQTLAASDGAVVAGFGVVWLTFLIVGLLLSVFWIWMLVDCLTSSLPSTEKLIWVLVIFFLHILGALLYYFMARQGGTGRRPGIV
jgi:hypothetical protein